MRLLVIGGSLALLGSALLGSAAGAQTAMAPHPSHIHDGSCPAPGKVVQDLVDVSGQFLHDGTAMVSAPMGPTPATMVEAGVTTVPMAYGDLFASTHSIVVHKSADEMGMYLVCGDIGGPEMGATDIAIGLGAIGDSGYTGIATLHDNGDSTTTVSVYVTTSAAMMEHPEMSPAS
jgi:hypothetical protein